MSRVFTVATLLALMALATPARAGLCTEGDRKCGPDGMVLRCTYLGEEWRPTDTPCKEPSAYASDDPGPGNAGANGQRHALLGCTPGDLKCAPDGKILRCRWGGREWLPTDAACTRPGDPADDAWAHDEPAEGANPAAVRACLPGDRKCAPDGKVLRCTHTNKAWEPTGLACAGRAGQARPAHGQRRRDAGCTPGGKKCGPDDRVLRCGLSGREWIPAGVGCH